MLKKSMCLLTMLLFSLPAYSQSKLNVWVFGGRTAKFGTISSGLLNDWGDGPTVGIFVSRSLIGPISVRGEFSYSSLLYDGPHLLMNSPADAQLFWNASATPTNVYKLAIGIDESKEFGPITPFVGLQAGVYYIHMGRITLSFAPDQHNSLPVGLPSSYNYYGTGVASADPFLGLKIGSDFHILDNVFVNVRAGYDATFNRTAGFVPVSVAIGI